MKAYAEMHYLAGRSSFDGAQWVSSIFGRVNLPTWRDALSPCRFRLFPGWAMPVIGGDDPKSNDEFFPQCNSCQTWLYVTGSSLRRKLIHKSHRQLNRSAILADRYRQLSVFPRSSAYAGNGASTAIEMGDGEVARLCFDALGRRMSSDKWLRVSGIVRARQCGTHAVELFARSCCANGFRPLTKTTLHRDC